MPFGVTALIQILILTVFYVAQCFLLSRGNGNSAKKTRFQDWQRNLGERTEVVSHRRTTEGASQFRRQSEAPRPERKVKKAYRSAGEVKMQKIEGTRQEKGIRLFLLSQ